MLLKSISPTNDKTMDMRWQRWLFRMMKIQVDCEKLQKIFSQLEELGTKLKMRFSADLYEVMFMRGQVYIRTHTHIHTQRPIELIGSELLNQ